MQKGRKKRIERRCQVGCVCRRNAAAKATLATIYKLHAGTCKISSQQPDFNNFG